MKWRTKIISCIARLSIIVAAVSLGSISSHSAEDQSPIAILYTVIKQLQDGRPDPNLFGDQLLKTIADQTNNSGRYLPLTALGPVTAVNLMQSQEYPSGQLYFLQAQHMNGVSSWTLGVNSISKRVEYGNFNVIPYGAPAIAGSQASPLIPPSPDKFRNSGYPTAPCMKYPALC